MAGSHSQSIELRGVRVHNLQGIDLDLPLRRLIAVSGVSGSGKSSLAFDTLYAEGQRRYVETFSAYARQFLDQLERPDADRIDHIPPAIALKQRSVNLGRKATIGTTTEIHDYLGLLFAKIGRIFCPQCGAEVSRDTPETVLNDVRQFAAGTRFQVCFPVDFGEDAENAEDNVQATLAELVRDGFHRVIAGGATVATESLVDSGSVARGSEFWAVVDRLQADSSTDQRLLDSIETAFRFGSDRCVLLERADDAAGGEFRDIDGRGWHLHRYNARLICESCGTEFTEPEPRLFSFNSSLGACPACEGFGAVPTISYDVLVPDPSKSLREGAIAAWTTPAYRHELDELLELAHEYGIPVDVPFSELEPPHLELIEHGVPERNFGGLRGFFDWLERHKYKLGVRVFLNRWRAYEECAACGGARLQPLALSVRIEGRNIAELCRLPIRDAAEFCDSLDAELSPHEREVSRIVLHEVRVRLGYLLDVGLDYVTLDRTLRTLSSGEAQRVMLTSTLGSSLVNTLYVLDEPSAGLHPNDAQRVIHAVERLRDNRNTVVVVEHDAEFLNAADHVVDIGPGAGRDGGRVVFEGTPAELSRHESSATGLYLSGRLSSIAEMPTREPYGEEQGALRLSGARRHNLQNLTVEFPLGVLCVITGVSGSGKSTLLEETLYPAVCQALKQPCDVRARAAFDSLAGATAIDEVVRVDQSPLGRTPRSNPVTYLKAFDDIRREFAATPDAKLRNFTARHFSFNARDGGQCAECNGTGELGVDMQFLADVTMTCPECHGTRFRREILEVKYRGLSIADVLAMTVREAFTFFRNHRKLQRRLGVLKEIGLDYLPLGQPATTLSGGESQRIKLAAALTSNTRSRTLFLIDEPTVGLHAADVVKLLDCFRNLLAVGHSLIVVEHDLQVIRAADHVIDLGPGAGSAGGRIVATGAPEQIATTKDSVTGRYLIGADK